MPALWNHLGGGRWHRLSLTWPSAGTVNYVRTLLPCCERLFPKLGKESLCQIAVHGCLVRIPFQVLALDQVFNPLLDQFWVGLEEGKLR